MTGAADPEAVVLTSTDVPEMLDLVERTRPGPFLPRTVELGTYLEAFMLSGLLCLVASLMVLFIGQSPETAAPVPVPAE